MAQLSAPFNAQQFDPTQGGNFQQLSVGKHPVTIIASEVKATADNTGGMVVYQVKAIDGPCKDVEMAYRLNLYNASEKARGIAESQQSALCHVIGVFMLTDTQQLHNIPFVVEVKEQPLTAQQQEKKAAGETVTPFHQIVRVYDMNGNEPRSAGNTQQAAPAPAPTPAAAQQPATAGGWGALAGQQPVQTPPQQPATGVWQPAPTPATGGWAQGGAAAGGQPAWGKK